MAQYPGITLTNAGINMIAESQASGTALIFTNLKMGDGKLSDGEDIKALTAVKNPLLTALVSSYTNQGDGQIKARYVVSNSGLTTGFFAREIGIYAKLGTNGAEQLYAYTNAGNLSDYIPDKSTPVDEQIIDIYIVVSNANGVTVVTDSSIVYITKKDLDEHKAAADSHAPAFAAHNSDAASHADIRAALKKAGGVPIGTITARLSKNPEAGELALDTGALVSRATYPDLWEWVQSSAPLLSEADWQTQAAAQSSVGAFSTGDGSTTFRLPRLLDYMRGGAAADVGTWQVDMFKSHTHDYDNMQGGGVANSVSDTTAAQTDATSQTGHITGSTGGTETRPKTIKVLYCVKAFDAETTQGLIDITALANEMAGKVDKTTYAADFANGFGTNGYQKLPSGLILQWGQATSNGTGVPNLSVTFPISFPNSCAVVTANANGNPNPGCFVEISSISKTAANMLVTTYNGSISSELVYWFAIGY